MVIKEVSMSPKDTVFFWIEIETGGYQIAGKFSILDAHVVDLLRDMRRKYGTAKSVIMFRGKELGIAD